MAKFYWRLYGGAQTWSPPPPPSTNKCRRIFLNWSMSKVEKSSLKGQLPTLAPPRGTQRLFSVKYMFGEANKYCLEIFVTWERLKISRWPYHSCAIFEAYLINSLRFSDVYFSHFTSQVRLFFVEKRKPIIFGLKTAMEKEIRKFLTFVVLQIASKIFGKIILKPF